MATKTKRKMSAAQKAALAKGRAALARKRGKKTTSTAKKSRKKSPPKKTYSASAVKPVFTVAAPVTVRKRRKPSNSGEVMATAKKRSTGSTVRKAGSRARRFIQDSGFLETVKNTSLLIAGGVASAVVVNKVPVKDARIKAALPIIAGMGIAGTIGKTNDLARQVATGMMAIGMISLFKKLAPNVPMLAGEEVYYLPQYGAGYGCLPDYSGENVDLSGNVSLGYEPFLTPASF